MDDDVLAVLQRCFDLAREGAHTELRIALDLGVPPDLTNSKGDTLLILAAYHGQADTVALLLERGAALDRANDNGQTALGAAVFRRSAPVVGALIAAGADPDAGARSARSVAEFFDLPEMTALFDL